MSTNHECPYCGEKLRAQQSTDGTKSELQRQIVFLEAQLMEAVMSRPKCSDKAFTAYVKGAVADALAKERTAWEKREAEWRRIMATHVGEATEMAVAKGTIENDPSYQSFLKMSRKGRQGGRFLAGRTAPPLADPCGFARC